MKTRILFTLSCAIIAAITNVPSGLGLVQQYDGYGPQNPTCGESGNNGLKSALIKPTIEDLIGKLSDGMILNAGECISAERVDTTGKAEAEYCGNSEQNLLPTNVHTVRGHFDRLLEWCRDAFAKDNGSLEFNPAHYVVKLSFEASGNTTAPQWKLDYSIIAAAIEELRKMEEARRNKSTSRKRTLRVFAG